MSKTSRSAFAPADAYASEGVLARRFKLIDERPDRAPIVPDEADNALVARAWAIALLGEWSDI